jgi:hypothetical protein
MGEVLMVVKAKKSPVRTTASTRITTKPLTTDARKNTGAKAPTKSTARNRVAGARAVKGAGSAQRAPASEPAARAKPTRVTTARKAPAKAPLRPATKSTVASSRRRRTALGELRVVIEHGPKGKKLAAVAPDWPGLERGGKEPRAAVELLRSYLPRYAAVAKLAGLDAEFASISATEVVEEYRGPGSTDFWGISFGFSSIDTHVMSTEQLARELALMQACWTYFDGVRARVSSEMLKGPRGGGRDRDRIVSHVLGVEQDWATKLGVGTPQGAVITDGRGLKAYRNAYCTAIRTFHAEGKMARTWPLRYLIRHTAFHTMDHAWEMEDKDLTVRAR